MKKEIEELLLKIESLKEAVKIDKREMTDDEIDKSTAMLDRVDKLEKLVELEERSAKTAERMNQSQSALIIPTPEKRSLITINDKPGFKSIGEQLIAVHRAGYPGGHVDPRLMEKRSTGLNEAAPADGGFLIQQDLSSSLWQRTYDSSALYNKCWRIPIGPGKNGLKLNAIDESSRADGSRMGGVLAYWKGEGAATTASKPKFSQRELNLNKLFALCYATDELLDDATALGAIINKTYPEEINFKIQDAIIQGTGVGQPLGILNGGATVSVAIETGQDGATVVAENIDKMWSRLYAPCRTNAMWLINQDVEPQLQGMFRAVGTGGIPAYMPAGGLSQSPYGTLLGRPVVPIEQCKTLGTVGDIMLVDMSQYLIIDKGGVKSDVSIHVQFLYDELVYRFITRIDGQPVWDTHLTPFSGSTNYLSPFITLAVRA